jgi:aminoglycoside phosphotransferase (APT) family kinase protein
MRPLAAGRASSVFDLGDGRVLRRGGAPAREAALMELARRHGYAVPAVHEVRRDALVLELVPGPTMLEALRDDPRSHEEHATTLAELHHSLHRIRAPSGGMLLHLDLHPQNVILSPHGPVVVDWTNARGGEPALDPALTWVILATSGGERGRTFGERFLRRFDGGEIARVLPDAVAYRLADENVGAEERELVRALLG